MADRGAPALSDSGKSSILGSAEMMQPDPSRAQDDKRSEERSVRRDELRRKPSAEEPAGPRAGARLTFGDELRRERELRRFSLVEVSESTKINRRYLEALEANEFSRLPGGLFNRSFVRAYCQTIGIDAEAMANAYLLEEQAQRSKGGRFDPDVLRGDPAARSFAARGGAPRARTARRSGLIRWVLVALLVAAVVTVAVLAYLRFGSPQDDPALPADTSQARTEAIGDPAVSGAEI